MVSGMLFKIAKGTRLLSDSLTIGPYGSYDPVTWYFHDNKPSAPEEVILVPWDLPRIQNVLLIVLSRCSGRRNESTNNNDLQTR